MRSEHDGSGNARRLQKVAARLAREIWIRVEDGIHLRSQNLGMVMQRIAGEQRCPLPGIDRDRRVKRTVAGRRQVANAGQNLAAVDGNHDRLAGADDGIHAIGAGHETGPVSLDVVFRIGEESVLVCAEHVARIRKGRAQDCAAPDRVPPDMIGVEMG